MHQLSRCVRMFQCLTCLPDPRFKPNHIKDLIGLVHPQVRKCIPVHVLHRNASATFVLEKIVNANDVRVGQVKCPARLPFEIIHGGPVGDDEFGKELEGDFALQVLVERQPHHPHPASAKLSAQDEPLENHLP
jgi:hypothetical protein